MWPLLLQVYGRIFRVVEPKRAQLNAATAQLAEKQAALAEAQSKLREVRSIVYQIDRCLDTSSSNVYIQRVGSWKKSNSSYLQCFELTWRFKEGSTREKCSAHSLQQRRRNTSKWAKGKNHRQWYIILTHNRTPWPWHSRVTGEAGFSVSQGEHKTIRNLVILKGTWQLWHDTHY